MKPLARWTIGPVIDQGWDILFESLNSFSLAYPEFDIIVCYNNLTSDAHINKIEYLKSKYSVFKQENFFCDLVMPTEGNENWPNGNWNWPCGWKLVPPRLRMDSCEIWIDNDLIIRRRLPTLDAWMKVNKGVLISKGLHNLYGVYKKFIPQRFKFCAGFFGLSSNFDFEKEIKKWLPELKGKSLGGFDEQGLVSVICSLSDPCFIVPQKELKIISCDSNINLFPNGVHFVGANRTYHRAWRIYKAKFFL